MKIILVGILLLIVMISFVSPMEYSSDTFPRLEAPETASSTSNNVSNLSQLDDIDEADVLAANNGDILTWSSALQLWIAQAAGAATTFLGLTDTPVAYTGAGGDYVKVNVGETGLEFVAFAGGGDNSSWNETYADTRYAAIGVGGDNASWNETYADTIYANITHNYNMTTAINDTQLQVNEGKLMIIVSWFSTKFNELFGLKTTDDLAEGTTNLYNNASWNQTIGDELYLPHTIDTNASSCGDGYYLDGDGICYDLNSTIDNKLITKYYNATSNYSIAGTIQGVLVSTQHLDGLYDDISYNITEVSGSPGMDVRINFTGVTGFNTGVMRYKAPVVFGSGPIIQVWDYVNLMWEDYPVLMDTNSWVVIEQTVFDNANHLEDGIVQMRLYKSSNGNTNNKYIFDWIAISRGVGTPAGEEVDPFSYHKNHNINATGYNITVDYLCESTGECFNITWLNYTDGTGSSTGGDFFHDNFTEAFNNNLSEFTETFNSTYNATYDSYAYNMTYGINDTQFKVTEGNVTILQSWLDTLITALGYIKSSSGGDYYHDNFTESFNNNLTEFTDVFNSTYNATYDAFALNVSLNYTKLIYDEFNAIWSAGGGDFNSADYQAAFLNNLSEFTEVFNSTYNITYDAYALNVSINYSQLTYDEWNTIWSAGAGDTNCSDESCAEILYWANESVLNVNSSAAWNDTFARNDTQMENNGGTLNILQSWFSTLFDALFGDKTTDDLTEGTTNLYQNKSFNETSVYQISINKTGTQIDFEDKNLTNVDIICLNTACTSYFNATCKVLSNGATTCEGT